MKKKILVLFAHPAFEKSRVNRMLIRNLNNIEGVTFHDLYEAYPDFDIDVGKEQALLEAHDLIVFHHPFYWYSTPALIKEYLDLVFEHNWAFGHEGNALKGKFLLQVISTGARAENYCSEGSHHYTIQELLTPMRQTALLCKMKYVPPFMIYGTLNISDKAIIMHRDHLEEIYRNFTAGNIDFNTLSSECQISITPNDKED